MQTTQQPIVKNTWVYEETVVYNNILLSSEKKIKSTQVAITWIEMKLTKRGSNAKLFFSCMGHKEIQ